MNYQCIHRDGGKCDVVMENGNVHTLDFSNFTGAYLLEAILEAVAAKARYEGFCKAQDIVCGTSGEKKEDAA